MAASDGRSPEQIRQEIEARREQLANSVESLRAGLGEATDIGGKLRANLPAAAAGALALGFVLAGGVGATMRFLARHGREGDARVRLGPFTIVDRG